MIHLDAFAADAGEAGSGETVGSRHRPELDPVGARMGGFLFLPRVRLGRLQDDNIFAVQNDTRRDVITLIEPALEIRSDWNVHALRLAADGAVGRYAENSSEDYKDSALIVDGRLDISRGSQLTAGLRRAHSHEDRASPDDVNGTIPTEYDDSSVFVSSFSRLGRISLKLDVWAQRLDYQDVPGLTGVINNDDRDRTTKVVTFRVGYEFLPEREVFIRAGANSRTYVAAVDDFGISRDSQGQEVVVGAATEFSRIVSGELFLGHLIQDYEDPRLVTVDEPTYGGSIIWNPTGLSTITVTVKRLAEETTFEGASAIRATRYGIAVDHELLRNLIVSIGAARQNNDYQGIERTDEIDETRVGAKYMANRNFYILFDYQRTRRASSSSLADYARSRYAITLQAQL